MKTAHVLAGAASAGTTPRRGRPRDTAADARILAAATELILHRGFDAMTIDEVATMAKVGKATVYRRWARKEDLALAAMEQVYARELVRPDTGSLRGDLRAMYAAVLAFVNTAEGAAYLRTAISESVRDPRIAALYRDAEDRASAHTYALFDSAVARGEIQAHQNARWAVEWIGGLLSAATINGRPLPTVDQVDELVDFVLGGVGA